MHGFFAKAADVLKRRLKGISAILALSMVALAPAPAAADVNFGIGFKFDNGHIFFGNNGVRHFHTYPRRHYCLTPRQVRYELRDHGYHHFHNGRVRGKFVRVRAVKNGWIRRVVVNRCTGKIVRSTKVRKWRKHYRRSGYDGISFRIWFGS